MVTLKAARVIETRPATVGLHIPKGYKQTEVGIIPDDWEPCTIEELIDRGAILGHLDGNHGELYPRSHEFKESGVPYITANDLCGHRVDFSNCKYLSEERASRFRKGVAKNGDVLFAHNATVGPTALLSTELDYVILSTTATYFRCNPEKLTNSFLLYMLQSSLFVSQYRAVMGQSTRNQVPITAQRKLSIVLPSTRAEQEAIAGALSDADVLIESLEQLIAKKRQIKKGAMQELLSGKKRLAGFEVELGYKQSEVGVIPEDWGVLALGDVTDCLDNLRIPLNDAQRATRRGDIPYCGANGVLDFIDDYVIDDDIILIAEDGGYFDEYETRPIAYCMTGKCWVNNHAHILKAKVGTDQGFIYFSLVHKNILRFLASGTRAKLNRAELDKIEVPLPPTRAEQTTIAAILSDMDAEIAVLEEKLAKARMIKQGMMQELLTGKTRLI